MGSSDLQLIFPMFIFITLVCVLTSFFVFSGNDCSLKDDMLPEVPYTPGLVGNDVNESTYESGANESKEYGFWNFMQTLIGGATAAVGTVLAFAGSPWSIFLTAGGTYTALASIPGISTVLANIPLIGGIVNGLNYVTTALASFGGLMTYSVPFFGNIPIFGVLIVMPIGFFIFIFVLRFIRGQG